MYLKKHRITERNTNMENHVIKARSISGTPDAGKFKFSKSSIFCYNLFSKIRSKNEKLQKTTTNLQGKQEKH